MIAECPTSVIPVESEATGWPRGTPMADMRRRRPQRRTQVGRCGILLGMRSSTKMPPGQGDLPYAKRRGSVR